LEIGDLTQLHRGWVGQAAGVGNEKQILKFHRLGHWKSVNLKPESDGRMTDEI